MAVSTDGGKENVDGFAGYVSWSPKDVFEASYQPMNSLSFGHAIIALMNGEKVARTECSVDSKLRKL